MHLNNQWDNNIIEPVGLGVYHYVSYNEVQKCHVGPRFPSDFIAGFFIHGPIFYMSGMIATTFCVWIVHVLKMDSYSPNVTKQEASLALL